MKYGLCSVNPDGKNKTIKVNNASIAKQVLRDLAHDSPCGSLWAKNAFDDLCMLSAS
jgi:hypothetical protein